MNRNRLYLYLSLACAAGYGWLLYTWDKNLHGYDGAMEVCLLKHIANLPCPSCGTTRAVILLMEGNIMASLQMNPSGLLIACILLLAPVWILSDMITRKNTMFSFYRHAETFLRRKAVAIPCMLLVIVNWLWNISKEL